MSARLQLVQGIRAQEIIFTPASLSPLNLNLSPVGYLPDEFDGGLFPNLSYIDVNDETNTCRKCENLIPLIQLEK